MTGYMSEIRKVKVSLKYKELLIALAATCPIVAIGVFIILTIPRFELDKPVFTWTEQFLLSLGIALLWSLTVYLVFARRALEHKKEEK